MKVIKAMITLKNLNLDTTLTSEEISINEDYKNDEPFKVTVSRFKAMAEKHNFQTGTAGIEDDVSVVLEELDPNDASFIYRLNDHIED